MARAVEVEPQTEVWLGGAKLQSSRHVCAFFHTLDEHYALLLPFIKDGIDQHQRAVHIVDPAQRANHLQRLRDCGIDTSSAEARDQLQVMVWQEAYLRGGHFDQDAMLALIEQVLKAGPALGYPMTRLVAQMEWALEDRPGVDDLVEYETRLNYVLPRYPDAVT